MSFGPLKRRGTRLQLRAGIGRLGVKPIERSAGSGYCSWTRRVAAAPTAPVC